MKRDPVASRSVSSVGYDRDTATLEVEFISGRIYRYFLIPARIHNELMTTESKGRYLNDHVKAAGFTFRRIR